MKTGKYSGCIRFNHSFYRLLFVLVLLFKVVSLNSQESPVRVYPSFGLSYGFFYPKDVNNFIKNDLSSHSLTTTSGSSDMFSYFELRGGLTVKMKKIDFNGIGEYAIAPKVILVTNGSSQTYYFSRTTIGAVSDFFIPLGSSGRSSFFVGGGVLYSFMKFKSYTASAPGLRLQTGVSLQFGKFNLEPNLAFTYAKASKHMTYSNFEMNYTGGQISLIFSFHKP
jgi:hypothetical protein